MDNFFDNNGITATSANHICNMAKEHYETIEQELKNICFYSTEIELLTAGKKVTTEKGCTKDTLNNLSNKIQEIAECKSLIAYLREAIKRKENLTLEIKAAISDKILPDVEIPVVPKLVPYLGSTDEVLETWPIEKVLRYYKLQTIASTYGEQVHPKGDIAEARKKYYNILTKPNSVTLDGSDTIINTFTPTVEKEALEGVYFDLQAKQRKAQAEFNSLQTEIDNTLRDAKDKALSERQMLLTKYQTERDIYNDKVESARQAKLTEIKNLKIKIPDNMKGIFNKINSLSQN